MFSHIPQDTTHLIQRPCYQRGSPCQNPARNWTTRRPPDYRKETQTAVVWSCFPFIRSGQNRLARYRARGEKTRQTEEEVERQHQGTDKPGVRQVPEGSGEQGKTWRKLVAKSSVVPQGHSRLRDWWWWWWWWASNNMFINQLVYFFKGGDPQHDVSFGSWTGLWKINGHKALTETMNLNQCNTQKLSSTLTTGEKSTTTTKNKTKQKKTTGVRVHFPPE